MRHWFNNPISRAQPVASEERLHRAGACRVPSGYRMRRDGGKVSIVCNKECQNSLYNQVHGGAAVAAHEAVPLAIYNILSDIPFFPLKITKLDLVTTSESASAYAGMFQGVR